MINESSENEYKKINFIFVQYLTINRKYCMNNGEKMRLSKAIFILEQSLKSSYKFI